ncbi:MAG: BTAD domain-containing putative transcriptional regulator [Trueperaceae bacterium]|nr:BTAD domain-containing putative transcriptional regulator [Trueperaceae bacterium]
MRLHFLGTPGASGDAGWLEPPSRLLLLLAAYLASCNTSTWRDRDEVARLVWSDSEAARRSLNQLLYRYKDTPWVAGIERRGQQHLRWQAQSDLQLFRQAYADRDWHKALSHYRGDFLLGVETRSDDEIARWLASERSSLKKMWFETVRHEADRLSGARNFGAATALLLRALRQDPLDEGIVTDYMRSAARSGRRLDALKAYDAFRCQVDRDLGTTPKVTTSNLADDIRDGKLDPPPGSIVIMTSVDGVAGINGIGTVDEISGGDDGSSGIPTTPTLRGPHFPSDATPFVGRDAERRDLAERLRDPACRLVSILGPGGTGKTRLAVRAARDNVALFADGSFFVELAPLTSAEQIPAALVEVLGLEPPQRLGPIDYLCRQLAAKTVLLVFDNVEHLRGATAVITRLLGAAPYLTIMTTSQEPLGLRSEWQYHLGSLSFPPPDTDKPPETYDAVRLFVQSARQRSARFRLNSDNTAAVATICQTLHGNPLAIELAAAWVNTLHPRNLARELQTNLDLLESTTTDRPERQQSLRAAFEYSWSLLKQDEQDALAKLGVLQGSFTQEAARDITGATLRTLLSLIDKSLVTRDDDGRFRLLELIRYYAVQKLAHPGVDEQDAKQRHAHYYFTLLWSHNPASGTYTPHPGISSEDRTDTIERELGNMRAALRWLYDRRDVEKGVWLLDALGPMLVFRRGDYREVLCWTEDFLALPQLATPSELTGRVLDLQSWAYFEVGRFAHAEQANIRFLQICQQLNRQDDVAQVTTELGVIYCVQRQFERAADMLHRGATLFQQLDDPKNAAWALANLARNSYNQGDYAAAKRYSDQAIDIDKAHADIAPRVSLIAAEIARVQGRHDDALRYCSQSLHRELGVYELKIRRKLEQSLTVAFSLFVEIEEMIAAAKLWGAAERWRQSVGAVRYPDKQQDNARSLAKLQAATPTDVFDRALAEGRAMSLEKAAQLALDLCLSKLAP